MMISAGWGFLGFCFISGHRIFVTTPHYFDLSSHHFKVVRMERRRAGQGACNVHTNILSKLFPHGNQVGEFHRDDLAVASAEDVALAVLEDVGKAVVVAGIQEEASCART